MRKRLIKASSLDLEVLVKVLGLKVRRAKGEVTEA
jgi:hypothetical protein